MDCDGRMLMCVYVRFLDGLWWGNCNEWLNIGNSNYLGIKVFIKIIVCIIWLYVFNSVLWFERVILLVVIRMGD